MKFCDRGPKVLTGEVSCAYRVEIEYDVTTIRWFA